jgi:hypothetical protein
MRINLGIQTQIPVPIIGIASQNPNALQAQPVTQVQPQTVNQSIPKSVPTIVHEMPWHKAHPNLKNIK